MRHSTIILLLTALVAQVYSAPQLPFYFKDGKIGVNFAGYHAGVGAGSSSDGTGLGGGLVAFAGTPHGQSAKAGLGGGVGSNGVGGRLYSAASSGHSHAAAGLAGSVDEEKTEGHGVASAGAKSVAIANREGAEGEAAFQGSSGFSFSGGVVKNVQPVIETVEVRPVETVEVVKPVYKKVKTEIKTETTNEVNPLPLETGVKTDIETRFNVEAQAPPAVIVKEVYAEPPPTKVIHKEVIRYKPHHHHHFHKTAYIGGYIGGGGDFAAPPPPPPPPAPVVVYKKVQPVYKTVEVQPVIEKRVDVGVEGGLHAGAGAHGDLGATGGAGSQYSYNKQISVNRNPTFFADIFNIPISTLKAVGNFLGNAAGSTNVSVQKSASVHAGGYGYGYY